MQKHREVTLKRLERFKDYLRGLWYDQRETLELAVYSAPGRISYDEATQGTYETIELGETLAPLWSTHWVKLDFSIPEQWQGREVHLRWDSSSEACIWQDGQALQGLSGSGRYHGSPCHVRYPLTREASGDETWQFYVEVAINDPFGNPDNVPNPNPAGTRLGLLRTAEIATFRRDAWDLYWDFVIITDMAHQLDERSPRAGQALYTANAIANAFGNDSDRISKAREIAAAFLAQQNGDSQHVVYAMGHAHIDTAWRWTLAESKRKCVRSFATALRLMDDYPEYTFVCSQAVQLQWMKDLQPELYGRIKERVKEGRFIPVGGAWVEPDCNIPSGESLIRQFLYGQRFYEREFGERHRVFWLPDTFGYASALPQIMRGVGIEYFLTQKLSWNQFNKLPANTFYWEGLDGSQVLTHFPPADTYNGDGTVREVTEGTQKFRDHEYVNASMYLFGYGDGGGGPTGEMLEQLGRMSDVDGVPKVRLSTPNEFFDHTRQSARELTKWVGELYFEYHRGTYTTQAYTKWANRHAEILLRDIEFLAVINENMPYPQEELDRLWELVLLNQFHDILPGSSIAEVYEDARRDYLSVQEKGLILRNNVVENLAYQDDTDEITIINTLSFAREEIIQVTPDTNQFTYVNIEAMGYKTQNIDNQPPHPVTFQDKGDYYVVENRYIVVELNKTGTIRRLFDKVSGKDALTGLGNHFVLYDDTPNDWDAWDIDVFHLEKYEALPKAVSHTIFENEDLRCSIKFDYEFGNSTLSQVISLDAVSPYVVFMTDVIWHEKHKLLKVEFPLNVRTQNATYETQFGLVERPTHFNTSWDMAKFEVCGHRWGALIEHGFGVALLNDSKYGYSAHGNTLALSLLRAPTWPDQHADEGGHTFSYALMPFDGNPEKPIQQGLAFNVPLHVAYGSMEEPEKSYFSVDKSHVIIDTVKKAEDDDAIIVRLYEACGGRGEVTFRTAFEIKSVYVCNLLEDNLNEIALNEGEILLSINPFEIVTLKLYRQ